MASGMSSGVRKALYTIFGSSETALRVMGDLDTISDSSGVKGAPDVFMLRREFSYKIDVLVL
uniref:Uncharacterized protein n=1 Tax=Cucumis melo TaxID=3656 RepID=A0A9I9DKV7_CUCME